MIEDRGKKIAVRKLCIIFDGNAILLLNFVFEGVPKFLAFLPFPKYKI
jgi:hypothetical protein